jgi:cell division protein FtsZ
MGIGSSRGDDRSVAAAEMAISSPLLEASIDGAHGVLLSIQGGSDLGLFEINEAAQLVSNSAAPDANIIFGAVIDDALGDEVRVTVIAAGFDEGGTRRARPARATSSFTADPAPAAPAADTYRAPAPPVPADVWAAPSEPVNEPEPAPVSFGNAENGSPGAADSPWSDGRASEDRAAEDTGSGATAEENGVDAVPAPRPADSGAADSGPVTPVSRPDTAAAARVFDAATTRRRSVVFEEDDELDVPDFLK